jgi:hypothetical protein
MDADGLVEVTGDCNEAIDLDVKRFYMNGIAIKSTCPGCKKGCIQDLGQHYLSYPVANEDFEHTLYCQSCDLNWSVTLRLNLSLAVRP